jgi:ATP adenylyltransferase/5',5'''-P-1,P-4-tetraphosphate phosphorylase II
VLFAVLGAGAHLLLGAGCLNDSGTQPNETLCKVIGAYAGPLSGAGEQMRHLLALSLPFLIVAVGVAASRVRRALKPFLLSLFVAFVAVLAPLVAASVLRGQRV